MKLLIFVITLGLVGCAGATPVSQFSPPTTTAMTPAVGILPYGKTFRYTGGVQTFHVPRGVYRLVVIMLGAAGGLSHGEARGGRTYGILPVRPSETLYVYVGGQGTRPNGGFNGGGNGANTSNYNLGYGGGGASDVRQGGTSLQDRVLIAGGGGGHDDGFYVGPGFGFGGNGGALIGQNGADGGYNPCRLDGGGGGGGTQAYGGVGGCAGYGSGSNNGKPGMPGGLGYGGNGGTGGPGTGGYAGGSGGGGGGGYNGGGGGGGGQGSFAGYGGPGGGGGGGSSFAARKVISAQFWRGWFKATGNGLIVFDWR